MASARKSGRSEEIAERAVQGEERQPWKNEPSKERF